jgi:hypothetical protein
MSGSENISSSIKDATLEVGVKLDRFSTCENKVGYI